MRFLLTAVVFLVAGIIQTSLFEYIRIFDVVPNLFLVIVICFSLLKEGLEGGFIGALGGIIEDAVMAASLGLYTLLNTFLGISIGLVNKRVVRENLFVSIFFVFIFSLIYESIFYFVVFFFSGQQDILYAFNKIIIPESIYNAAITIIIFPLVIWIDMWVKEHARFARKY
ncbi:MAG: rod shape-determining protein MreD [Deltaproteobacteria bacterium]